MFPWLRSWFPDLLDDDRGRLGAICKQRTLRQTGSCDAAGRSVSATRPIMMVMD